MSRLTTLCAPACAGHAAPARAPDPNSDVRHRACTVLSLVLSRRCRVKGPCIARAPQPPMAAHPQPVGDRCAFPRNLTRGTYGGDVNCLQQHLFHSARRAHAFALRHQTATHQPPGALVAQSRELEIALTRLDCGCAGLPNGRGANGLLWAAHRGSAEEVAGCERDHATARRLRRVVACSIRQGARTAHARPRACARLRGARARAAALTPRRSDSRRKQKFGLPGPESGRVFLDTAGEESKTCIDVCAEFAGQQDCQTRCVRCVARAPQQLPCAPQVLLPPC